MRRFLCTWTTLLEIRLFNGDWTHPVNSDSDSDSIDDGWRIRYGLNPNQSNGVAGMILEFRENRARTISSIKLNRAEYPLRWDKFPYNLSHK